MALPTAREENRGPYSFFSLGIVQNRCYYCFAPGQSVHVVELVVPLDVPVMAYCPSLSSRFSSSSRSSLARDVVLRRVLTICTGACSIDSGSRDFLDLLDVRPGVHVLDDLVRPRLQGVLGPVFFFFGRRTGGRGEGRTVVALGQSYKKNRCRRVLISGPHPKYS